jgi:glycerol-3-phosphate dehydrogenase
MQISIHSVEDKDTLIKTRACIIYINTQDLKSGYYSKIAKKINKNKKTFYFLIYFLIDFQKLGVKTTHLNSEVVTKSNMVVIAVKPNTVQKVLTEVKDYVSKDKLMVSIAAGVTLSTLEKVKVLFINLVASYLGVNVNNVLGSCISK